MSSDDPSAVAGGWCAPAAADYSLTGPIEAHQRKLRKKVKKHRKKIKGLLALPEIRAERGGVQYSVADPVNHPSHYTAHPSGVECITITEHMGFNLGNAVKYVWRADLKGDSIQDLEKAAWYIKREIKRRKRPTPSKGC